MFRKLAVVVILVTIAVSLGLVSPAQALAAPTSCQQISNISGPAGSGSTNGVIGTFVAGDLIQITVTLTTATTGTFRIVGDPSGLVTLAGPSSIPGTLTYRATGSLPAGSLGIGYFIDSANGTVNVSASCSNGGTSSIPGPGIPAGFVLHTITCTVAVFDSPGGNPVGSNAITSGQTWYVNPVPVKDKNGKSWTEVFVGGFIDGFIPTSCVH